jgi:peptidoglycan/LPS O-acetylase OafA/YrhL
MRWSFAVLAAGALAFCVTLLLSLLSYHLIEGPLMGLKRHLRYGAVNEPHMFPAEIVEPALAKTGT